jgi:hypothetical protein
VKKEMVYMKAANKTGGTMNDKWSHTNLNVFGAMYAVVSRLITLSFTTSSECQWISDFFVLLEMVNKES